MLQHVVHVPSPEHDGSRTLVSADNLTWRFCFADSAAFSPPAAAPLPELRPFHWGSTHIQHPAEHLGFDSGNVLTRSQKSKLWSECFWNRDYLVTAVSQSQILVRFHRPPAAQTSSVSEPSNERQRSEVRGALNGSGVDGKKSSVRLLIVVLRTF